MLDKRIYDKETIKALLIGKTPKISARGSKKVIYAALAGNSVIVVTKFAADAKHPFGYGMVWSFVYGYLLLLF